MNGKRLFLNLLIGFGASAGLWSCSSRPPSETTTQNNAYFAAFSDLTDSKQNQALKSLENFAKLSAFDELKIASTKFKNEDLIVSGLDSEAKWFDSFFVTLTGIHIMAQSHSFRVYKNADCFDAFAKSSANINPSGSSELMSLGDFMKAGIRIPDDQTFTQQARAYCGRKAQIDLKNLDTEELKKLSLILKSNVVLQRKILARAEQESQLILQAYRTALGNRY